MSRKFSGNAPTRAAPVGGSAGSTRGVETPASKRGVDSSASKKSESSAKKKAAESSASKNNIQWDLPTEEWLAHRLVDNWKAWEKGPKIDLCRRWVEELKLKDVVSTTPAPPHIHIDIRGSN